MLPTFSLEWHRRMDCAAACSFDVGYIHDWIMMYKTSLQEQSGLAYGSGYYSARIGTGDVARECRYKLSIKSQELRSTGLLPDDVKEVIEDTFNREWKRKLELEWYRYHV